MCYIYCCLTSGVLGAGSLLLLGQTRADQLHQQPVVCWLRRRGAASLASTAEPAPARTTILTSMYIFYTIFSEGINRAGPSPCLLLILHTSTSHFGIYYHF